MSELMQYHSDHGHRIAVIEHGTKYIHALVVDFPPRHLKLAKTELRHMKPIFNYPKYRLCKILRSMEKRANSKMSKPAKRLMKEYEPTPEI